MSLIKILNDKIKEAGQLSVEEVEIIAKDNGRKISNAERRLRKSESPNIAPVKNKKGYITAYRWIGESIESPKIYKEKQEIFNFN